MELIRVPKVENVKLVDRLNYANPNVGTLYLTPTHVIFVDPNLKKEYWILLMHERDALDVYLSLNQLSQPAKISDLYCFFYNSQDETFDKKDGWSNFDIEAEYSRFISHSENWTLSDINSDYSICDTYPSKLYVPVLASKECLIESAKFRSRGRLPVLSYLYCNQAAICRCSQPLSGINNRSFEDESLLEHIAKANPTGKKELYIVDTRPKINAMANRAAGKGYENEQYYSGAKFHFFAIENIHVMRASLNKLLDACDIRLSMNYFLSNIESSHWLKHVKSLLETSNFISNSIKEGNSVIVHCSDGWDRTAQACSLSSIQLDPYYRTIKGFQALINKEWLSFGHKFSDRCGHILSDLRETAPVFTQFLDAVWQMLRQHPTEFEFNEDFLIVIHDHIYSCQFGTFIGNCERERIELKLSERTYSFWAYLDSHIIEYENPFYQPRTSHVHQIDYDNTGDTNYNNNRISNSNTNTNTNTANNNSSDKNINNDCETTKSIRNNQEGKCDIDDKAGKKLDNIAASFLNIDTSAQRVRFWRGLYNRHELLVHPRESPENLIITAKKELQSVTSHLQ